MQSPVTITAPDGQNHTFLKTVTTQSIFSITIWRDMATQHARKSTSMFLPATKPSILPHPGYIERGHAVCNVLVRDAAAPLCRCEIELTPTSTLQPDQSLQLPCRCACPHLDGSNFLTSDIMPLMVCLLVWRRDDQWCVAQGLKFDGFVSTVCYLDGAMSARIARNFIGTAQHLLQVQAQALRGGTDLNCGSLYGEQNAGAVQAGLLSEVDLMSHLSEYTKAFQLGILTLRRRLRDTRTRTLIALRRRCGDTASRALAMSALQGQVPQMRIGAYCLTWACAQMAQ